MIHSLLLALVLLSPQGTPPKRDETVQDELRRALNEYHYGNYQSAITQLRGLVYPMRLNTDDQFIEARKYLALSYYLTEQHELVEDEFAKLLHLSPDHELDPFEVPPPIIEIFERVRKQLKPQLDVIREKKREAEFKRAQLGLTIRTVERTLVEQSQIATLLPFGTGQFQNGDVGLGVAFLITELALVGVNIGSHLASLSMDQYAPSDRSLVELLTLVQYASLALFGVTWSAGIFEARLHFIPAYSRPPRITETTLESRLGGALGLQINF